MNKSELSCKNVPRSWMSCTFLHYFARSCKKLPRILQVLSDRLTRVGEKEKAKFVYNSMNCFFENSSPLIIKSIERFKFFRIIQSKILEVGAIWTNNKTSRWKNVAGEKQVLLSFFLPGLGLNPFSTFQQWSTIFIWV